ncbi:Hypothetical predicted protein [Pelobates cultripes]|uniref:Uncharacterized protein n=1 Tax=Pelobates cultripes TaxID=61616 RepID=A0AAD1RD21_PELCU|nr:Hypothetical predicted protein [Pelobates cultripes]
MPEWTLNPQHIVTQRHTAKSAKPKTGAGSQGRLTTSKGSKRVTLTLSGNIQAFPTLGIG